MTTLAQAMCRSIRRTQTSSTAACGSGRKVRGKTAHGRAPTAAFFRSSDGGETWIKLTGHGLPDDIIQVNVTIRAQRFAQGVCGHCHAEGWRRHFTGSDDEGVNWVHAPVDDNRAEARIGGGDVPVPRADPKDPDTVYVASVVTWRSTDAGKSWYGLRGAPGRR